MSLGTKLVQAVQKETAMQRPLPLHTMAHDALDGDTQRVIASVVLADNDRFSHMVKEVTVEIKTYSDAAAARPAKGKPRTPAQRAERFAARATYLTEALQFVENDAQGAAIVRSTPQTMSGKRTPYFEANVADDAFTLRRFEPNAGKPGRTATPFCLTDDVLTRLIDDAAAVLSPPGK